MGKKIIAILMALTMMPVTICINVHGEETTAAEPVIDMTVEESVKDLEEFSILYKLHIVDNDFSEYENANGIVSRGEAAIYLARLYKTEIDLKAFSDYVDVEAHRNISPYIKFVKDMGMFEKMDRQRFRPDEPILKDELSIMACRILGFGGLYDSLDEYPKQYYAQGADSKLYKGVQNGDTFTRREFFKVLINVLNADICTKTYNGDKVEFSTKSGKNLLEERFNVFKITGIVTGYGFENLSGKEQIATGKISVSHEQYNIESDNNTDYTKYVGHRVECYIKLDEKEEEKSIITIKPQADSMQYNFLGKDVCNDSNISRISYYSFDNKKLSYKISLNAVVLFNGQNSGRLDEDMLENLFKEESAVRLIDNDGNGDIEVIFIDQYDTCIVENVDVSEKRIYLKYDKLFCGKPYISLDESDGYTTELIFNGIKTQPEQLRKYNVLSCIATYEGDKLKNLRVIVSRKSATGLVERVSDDYYAINGNEYPMSEYYKSIVGKYPDTENIKIGREGKFYVDIFGNIAATSLVKDIYYGYMNRLFRKSDDPDSDEFCVEIYDETGVWVECDLSNKVILDGNSMKREKCAEQLLENGQFKSQVVRFTVKNDKITLIDTVSVGNGNTDTDILELKDTYQASMGTDYGNITGRYYRFINQTTFMILPENKKKKDQYSVIGRYGFTEGEVVYLNVYGIDEFNTVTFCVYDYSLMEGASDKSYENYVMVVESIEEVVNSDDEIAQQAHGYYARGGWGSGEMTEGVLEEAEPGVLNGVKTGDVLMFKLNSERKAIRVKSAFTREEAESSEPFHKNNTLKDETSFGTIVKVDPSRSLILMDIGGTETVFWYGAVAAYDLEKDEVIKISPKELTPGRKVFNWGYWNLPFLTLMYIE